MKIFNLGMSKTGTTSFHSLMEELYLTSTHDISISEHTVDELKKEFTKKRGFYENKLWSWKFCNFKKRFRK